MHPDYRPAKILRYASAADMIRAFPEPQRHYEDNGVILLEDCGIPYDAPFIWGVQFPADAGWKKIGTRNGITAPPIVFRDGKFIRTQNPLCAVVQDDKLLLKLYSELLRLELEFKLLIARIFPSYHGVDWQNCTFRFSKTENEEPHLDSFNGGVPMPLPMQLPRLKFFMNVDSEPRIWNVGPSLPDLLRFSEGALGQSLPADLNALCAKVNGSGIMARAPYVRVEIPPRGIVFANGATVVHQVLYGNRMVGLEGFMPASSLQSTQGGEWDQFKSWIESAGYALDS
jgi:hypothetical protein